MKFSWVILTFNRAQTVADAIAHNIKNAGRKIDEIIWVDNGSTDEVRNVMRGFDPDVSILNKENLGVAKGYNRGTVLATGTHILITGCDRKMPDNWVATYEDCFQDIPETGLISCYSCPLDQVPERHRSKHQGPESINGVNIIKAMPMGAKCFPRELMAEVGHLREDFGLYGWEDVEWGQRFERVCNSKGLITYTLPGFIAEHMGSEGIKEYNGIDKPDYHSFKAAEAADPKKGELMAKCAREGFQYYTPYV